MNKKRIAVEIWFHALVYYIGKPLAKISNSFKGNIWEHANPIDVNSNDSREKAFYAVWLAGSAIKAAIAVSPDKSIAKYAAYIIL